MEDSQEQESQSTILSSSQDNTFRPPSINTSTLLSGTSYSHYSPIPTVVQSDPSTPCVLGVDEAGRGPVLGPMVYGVFYCPLAIERDLLATTHHFDDSKVLTPQVRSDLMQKLCTPQTDLYEQCGWATTLLSAQSISAGMLRPNNTSNSSGTSKGAATGVYNLNAQAVDATIALVRGVLALGVNIAELYVDTIGRPETYQRRLEVLFPSMRVTVAKKADSLYPCVSAASVCAKVTRDAALEVCAEHLAAEMEEAEGECDWGSGYPSDARCVTWLKSNMHPLFGWGNECRHSWGTAKELLEGAKRQKGAVRVDWAVGDDEGDGAEDDMKMTKFLRAPIREGAGGTEQQEDELVVWYGRRVGAEVF